MRSKHHRVMLHVKKADTLRGGGGGEGGQTRVMKTLIERVLHALRRSATAGM